MSRSRGRIALLTGVCGAGKSTLALALAKRRARSVVLPIDDLRDLVVSGRADPTAEWTDETRTQFRIAHVSAARMAGVAATSAPYLLPLDADENRRYKAVKSGDDQSRAWFS